MFEVAVVLMQHPILPIREFEEEDSTGEVDDQVIVMMAENAVHEYTQEDESYI